MIIETLIATKDQYGVLLGYTVNGNVGVPIDVANSDYIEITKQLEAGTVTAEEEVQEVDESLV